MFFYFKTTVAYIMDLDLLFLKAFNAHDFAGNIDYY